MPFIIIAHSHASPAVGSVNLRQALFMTPWKPFTCMFIIHVKYKLGLAENPSGLSLCYFVLLKGMCGCQIAAWHKGSPGGVMGPTGSLTQFLQSCTSESDHGLCRAHCPIHGGELEEVEQSEIPCVRPVGGHSSDPMISSSHSSSGSPTVIALFGALAP